MTEKHIKRSPWLVFFCTLFLTLPITSDSTFYWFSYGIALLVVFPLAAWYSTRNFKISLLKQLKKYHPVLFYLLLGFAISSFISLFNVLYSSTSLGHKLFATQRYITQWLLVAYVFAMARFSITQELKQERLYELIIGGCLLLTVLLIGSYFIEGNAAITWISHPPFGAHMRIIGMMLAIACVTCTILFLFKENSVTQNSLLALALFICCTFLIWSGGRMSILVFLITGLLFSFLAYKKVPAWLGKIGMLLLIIGLSVLFSSALSIFPWNGMSRIDHITDATLNQDSAYAAFSQYGNGRIRVWATAIHGFLTAPLFGLGPYGYFFLDRPSWEDQTHNFIIEFLVEWGIIGSFFLLASLLYMALQGIKRFRWALDNKDSNWLVCAGVALAMTMNGLADGVYFFLLPCFVVLTAYTSFPFFTRQEVQRLRAIAKTKP